VPSISSTDEAIALVIGAVPSSANKRLRMHWSARKAEDEAIEWQLIAAIKRSTHRCKADGRRAWVTIHFTMRGRDDDLDNRTARAKGLIDALTRQGVIVDDSPEWCRFRPFTRERTTGRNMTTVTVEYVEAFRGA